MPIPKKYRARFEENGVYHVYNRTNNGEKLFQNDRNRQFFLEKLKEYVIPYADVFCWSLLPNHFHTMIRMFSRKKIDSILQKKTNKSKTEKKYLDKAIDVNDLASHVFRRFFQSYTQSLNKVQSRKGNLFNKSFRRVRINRESQFTQTFVYIHANAVKHQLTTDFESYAWSSWHNYISSDPGFICKEAVLNWFGGLENMIRIHRVLTESYYSCELAIE